MLLFTSCGSDPGHLAANGILDATDYSPANSGMLRLDGEWRFYWQEFIDPGSPPLDRGILVEQPGIWTRFAHPAEDVSRRGYASYHLRVRLGSLWPQRIGVRVQELSSAYRLYINGTLASQSGSPGIDETHTHPDRIPQTGIYHRTSSGELDIVIHAANFIDDDPGIIRSIQLGTASQALRRQHRNTAIGAFLAGALCLIGIYHIMLYFYRRRSPLPLLFAAACFLFAFRGLFEGERAVLRFIELPYVVYIRIWHILYYIIVSTVMLLLNKLFPQDANHRFSRFVLQLTGGFIALTTILPLHHAALLTSVYHAVSAAIILYAASTLYHAVRNRRPGAIPFSIAGGIATAAGINDMLYSEFLIDTAYIAPFGLLIFVLVQAYFLSVQYAENLERVETLSRRLDVYSRHLETLQKQKQTELHTRERQLTSTAAETASLQSALLPNRRDIAAVVPRSLLIWHPSEGVGGDFYWVKPTGARQGWIAVGDCSGHGIPGAMTAMMALHLLNKESEHMQPEDPAGFLGYLNDKLHKFQEGFELGLLYIDNTEIHFSGAHIGIFHVHTDGTVYHPGTLRRIGDERRKHRRFQTIRLQSEPSDRFFLTTNGFLNQNGGPRNHSFGRRRFIELLESLRPTSFATHQLKIETSLAEYAGSTPQRDDIVVIGFETVAQKDVAPT